MDFVTNIIKVSIFFICLSLLNGCKTRPLLGKHTLVFSEITYNIENGYSQRDDHYSLQMNEVSDSLSYKYMSKSDTFSLHFDKIFGNIYYENKSKRQLLVLEGIKEITVNNVDYSVSKYSMSSGTIDGNKTLFLERSIGLLIYRNDSWIYHRELQSIQLDLAVRYLVSIIKEDPHFYYTKNIFKDVSPPPDDILD
jgi:hypothetical protein